MNPYKILGIEETASQEEIKATFRIMSKKCHPDTGGDTEVFRDVKKAFDILSNKEKRDTYDLYGISLDFEKEAKALAFTVFFEVSSQLRQGVPLDIELKKFILVVISKYEMEMKELEERKTALQTRILRIVTAPEDNFISERAVDVIERYVMDYKIALLQRDLHKKALQLLTEYQFDRLQVQSNDSSPLSFLYQRPYKVNFDLKDHVQRWKL